MTAPRWEDIPWSNDGGIPRLNFDPEDAGESLGRLVVVVLDLVRQLLERQALRRVDQGDLTDEQVDRLGRALLALDERFAELREVFSGTGPEEVTAGGQGPAGSVDRQPVPTPVA